MVEDSQAEQEPEQDEPSFASHCDRLQVLEGRNTKHCHEPTGDCRVSQKPRAGRPGGFQEAWEGVSRPRKQGTSGLGAMNRGCSQVGQGLVPPRLRPRLTEEMLPGLVGGAAAGSQSTPGPPQLSPTVAVHP